MLTKAYTSTALTLALALGGLVGAVAPSGVSAQEVEEVVVTGSRIRRSDLTSISPISVLSDADLKASGSPTLENFLQDQPSTLGGADYGSSVNNGNPGLATVQLRGLGPNRTLVLLNGHRPASASTDGFVDLNMIPTAIIERVEILRDGASTVYGSDAIAGVVNIITKKDFEGFQLDAGYDETDESDGKQYNLALTWGQNFDRGHIVLVGQYTERDEILQRDRSFSDCPLQDASGGGQECGGSGTTTPAQTIPVIDNLDTYVVDQTTGEVRPFNAAGDAYNFAASSIMVTPQDVYSMYADASYMIVEEGFSTLNATMEAGFSNRESNQRLAPVGTFWGPTVPASNPFNPFGVAQCGANPNCTTPQDVGIARRLAESQGRTFNQDDNSWRFVLGLDGEFENGWAWNTIYNYADWSGSSRDGGRGVEPNVNGMVDPLCEVNANCTPLAGTGIAPWDPFNSNTLTEEQLTYGTVAINERDKSKLRVWQVNLTGDMMGLFELPGGEPAWALGYENRTERASSEPDAGAALDAVYGVTANPTSGSYDVDEIYGELSLPLLAGMPFAELLTIEGSFRWSDYDFVPSDTTYKVGVEWAPISDIRFRYTYGEGFRAPNITERFLGEQQTAASYADPCANWDTSGNPTIIANCGPGGDNLAPGFVPNAPQASTIEGGNPDLQPEESTAWTAGFVLTPSFFENFSLAVDYWDIKIDDAVGTAGTGNVITRCYNSANFTDDLCQFLIGPTLVGEGASSVAPARRNVQNQVTGILLTNQNLSEFKTKGIDVQADYAFDTQIGRFSIDVTGTYVDEYTYTPVVGGAAEELKGKFGIDPFNKNAITAFPEWAVNTQVGFVRDNWGANLLFRWFDSTEDGIGDCEVCTAEDKLYTDLQGFYEWDNMVFTLGVLNLTDEDPPYVTNYDDMNTLHYSYDTAGRYFYGRYSIKF